MTRPSAPPSASRGSTADPAWWRSAVIYQVYIRSFADGDGDGLGDVAGLRARLGHVADLGVDAIWINPWYPSPMADAGYDVSDYRDVEPRFGTLADAEALVAQAHGLGLRVLLDIVPNHTSSAHPWFTEALAAGPGSPARERYLFRAGRGPEGAEPPNDWRSVFGGPAWTRVTEPDGTAGQWYLHLFDPAQPDVNWEHPEVRADFAETLRFWFDRGVDGFRIDVAHSLVKEPGLPDLGGRSHLPTRKVEVDGELVRPEWRAHPHWDRDEVHEVYREWRKIADSYTPPRVFVAEAWVDEPERLSRYLRADELHTAFNFGYLTTPWDAAAMRATIAETVAEHDAVGAAPTWVLSNHDVARHLSRYARPQTNGSPNLGDLAGRPADLALGTRRSRAAVLLTLALPGGAYVYQGEELGLPEVEDLPDDVLQDPTWRRSGGTDRGRDGCRVPIPWSGDAPPYGFGPGPGTWLPQPPDWGPLTVAAQTGDPGSMLELYRAALRMRRGLAALGDGPTTLHVDGPAEVVALDRGPGFTCVVNMGADAVPLPAGEVLLASVPLPAGGTLPGDAAVWLAR